MGGQRLMLCVRRSAAHGIVRVGMAFLAAAAALTGCGAEPSDGEGIGGGVGARPPAAPASLLWRELGHWSGRGDRQTGSFEIASGALRLTWSAQAEHEPGAGSLRVSLHSAISGRPLETIVEHVGAGSDTVRLAAGPRVAYLLIESTGVDWSVRLDEGAAASGGAARPEARPEGSAGS